MGWLVRSGLGLAVGRYAWRNRARLTALRSVRVAAPRRVRRRDGIVDEGQGCRNGGHGQGEDSGAGWAGD